MTALNLIVADQLNGFHAAVEKEMAKGTEKRLAIVGVLRKFIKDSKNVRFEGDGYSDAWVKEAEKRGLSNVKNTPRAIEAYLTPENINLFERNGVLSKVELEARQEIKLENYIKKVQIEARVMGDLALNHALLGEERVIVSDIAGTTRDAIDTPFEYEGQQMTLIDTAGIRRPGRVEGSIEHYSVMRSRDAVRRADIAVVVFDATLRLRAQDLHIMSIALEESTGLVMCANKWDLIKETWDETKFRAGMHRRLRFATWAPIVVTSALEKTGFDELMTEVRAAGEERKRRVQTSELNAIVRGALARRPPTLTGRKRLKLLYVTQARTEPPTFVFFVNDASLVSPTYKRYLENALRRFFGFRAAGLRLIFRTRGEDDVEDERRRERGERVPRRRASRAAS
jgi:GTP-binding protein